MDLFLIPNNPEKTVIVSPNGVAHYKVATSKNKAGVKVSRIQRPAETEEESVVAEIEWKHWDRPTVVRSCLHGGLGEEQTRKGRVQAMDFLYKKHPFSATRYFMGDDGLEYRWKTRKGRGVILYSCQNNQELACCVNSTTEEGLYAGERKARLRIQPCSLDIDLIVVSYLIMEKKRRDSVGVQAALAPYDEDPADGAADGGE